MTKLGSVSKEGELFRDISGKLVANDLVIQWLKRERRISHVSFFMPEPVK